MAAALATGHAAAQAQTQAPAPPLAAAAASGPPEAPVDKTVPELQGRGRLSPFVGRLVRTHGVVTRVNQNGFFIQDPVGDGDPLTSDGLFVFTGAQRPTAAVVGHHLALVGRVAEHNVGAATNAQTAAHPVTQLTALASVQVLATGQSVAPTPVTLPEAVDDDLERHEGMLVTLAGPLTVQQVNFQAPFGQVTLGVGGRHETPTNRHRPGSAQAIALADLQARQRIVLDDGLTTAYPNPTPHLPASGLLRAGDTVASVTGVIDYGLASASSQGPGDHRIHPTQPLAFTSAGRPPRPAVPGTLVVASLNVLNFFTTFADGQTADGQQGQGCRQGGSVAASFCRGASHPAEFERQRRKTVAALAGLDADAVALMEVQNNGNTAVEHLVAALNQAVGAGTYASVALPEGPEATGGDAIRTALVYRPAKLRPLGPPVSDTHPVNSRPTLAQTFALPNGERLTLVVNHFKSKGSCPAADDPQAAGNANNGDGQGCWTATRVAQARRLHAFVSGLGHMATGVANGTTTGGAAGATSTSAGRPHTLLLGDFNAYAQEDPLHQLKADGWHDLLADHPLGYSYVFGGTAGRLDHALASPALAAKVVASAHWHLNADEGPQHDYNLEHKPPACPACAPDPYQPHAWRSSDHDPVLVGLDLSRVLPAQRGALAAGPGADRIVFSSLHQAGGRLQGFTPGEDRIDLRPLLQRLGLSGRQALARGLLRWHAVADGLVLTLDPDGRSGRAPARKLLRLDAVDTARFDPVRDLVLP